MCIKFSLLICFSEPLFWALFSLSLNQVPDFNDMYELYDPCTVMFFFRNKHIMIDLGTGNNNKISWAFNNKQEVGQSSARSSQQHNSSK